MRVLDARADRAQLRLGLLPEDEMTILQAPESRHPCHRPRRSARVFQTSLPAATHPTHRPDPGKPFRQRSYRDPDMSFELFQHEITHTAWSVI